MLLQASLYCSETAGRKWCNWFNAQNWTTWFIPSQICIQECLFTIASLQNLHYKDNYCCYICLASDTKTLLSICNTFPLSQRNLKWYILTNCLDQLGSWAGLAKKTVKKKTFSSQLESYLIHSVFFQIRVFFKVCLNKFTSERRGEDKIAERDMPDLIAGC